MKITCEIIRDLLPLYAENMASPDSRKLVENHLGGCEACTSVLEEMKKEAAIPIETNPEGLNRLKRNIRRRRILSVMTAVMLIITIVLSGALLLDARIYLPAEMAIESVEQREDGQIRVGLSKYVIGAGSIAPLEEDQSMGKNVGIIAWSNLNKILTAKDRVPYEQMPEEYRNVVSKEDYGTKGYGVGDFGLGDETWDSNLWYCAKDSTGQTLLWDAGHEYNGEPLDENVNYHIGWYCLILAGLAVFFQILRKVLPLAWMKELSVRLAILCGSLSLSTVIVTAGQFVELWGEFTEAVIDGTLPAVPMTLTGLLIRQLWLLNQQDKGNFNG